METDRRDKEWSITEGSYHPANERRGGTLFCIGNGLLGLRGSYEELGTKEVQGLYAAGVYRKCEQQLFFVADTFCRKKYIFNEDLMAVPHPTLLIQNLPDPLYCRIYLAGIPFRMWDGHLLAYERSLDLATGELTRRVRWEDGQGRITSLVFRRFCSMADRHLIAQRISIAPENWSGEVRIESGIDASLNSEYRESVIGETATGLHLRSDIPGGAQVFQCMENRLEGFADAWSFHVDARRYRKIASVQAQEGQTLTLEKFATVCSSRDEPPREAAETLARRAAEEGFSRCLEASSTVWKTLWEQADIQIEGDPDAQRKIRYALFHLIIAAPQTDSRVSIGAKGLSGEGYNGQVFWDADINLAPFYQWVFPEWGGAHVRYRRRMLDDARAYAASEGRAGARYPWQSSVEGFEHSPASITCSRTQIHVTADVAYCALRYADITGDTGWLHEEGAEMICECARYMAERVEWNEEKSRYEILGVGGPDEYHPVTDNNAYTNYLTAYVLRRAAGLCSMSEAGDGGQGCRSFGRCSAITEPLFESLYSESLCFANEEDTRSRIREACPTKDETARWLEIADKMYCPVDKETGLIPQCDGFFDLKDEWDVIGGEWGGPGGEYHECKGLKQPDVVLLTVLLPELFKKKYLQANWDYYERFVLNGSSLGPAIHALVAAKLGLMDKAMDYFNLSADFDTLDVNKDTWAGIHVGNFGGLWQAIAYGFAGMEIKGDDLAFDPHLPENWKSLSFNVNFRRQNLRVKVADGQASVTKKPQIKGVLFDLDGDLYPGVIDFLEKLKAQGLKLAICSSSKNAQTVLDALNLSRYFDAVVGGNDIVNPKPDPEIFLTGAQRLGLKPEECIVFEDAESGVEAALAAGMVCIGVGPAERLGAAHLCTTDYSALEPAQLL